MKIANTLMWVQNVTISYFHLSSPRPKPAQVHTSTPLALHEDQVRGNTNRVFPASWVQQRFSKVALHGHERSWQRNISLVECWRYDVVFNNVNSCLKGVIVLYFASLNQQSEIKRKININDNLQLDSFSIDQSIIFITLSASNFTFEQPCPIMVVL